MWRLLFVVTLVVSAAVGARANGAAHAIGVLATAAEPDAGERWNSMADYLERSISGHGFTIVPLRRDDLSRAVGRGNVDFVVTDPGHYVELEVLHGTAAIATLRRSAQRPGSTAGAAIIVRAGRRDIGSIPDLRGKSFMAESRESFAGFLLARLELQAHGIKPFRDLSPLMFSGAPAERVVVAVRDGLVDGGAVSTDVLERMLARGDVQADALRVLHPLATAEYPILRSTDLYPEWAFAATSNVSVDLRQRVGDALIAMPVAGSAANGAGYTGWSPPLSYASVDEVLRDLRISPYDSVVGRSGLEMSERGWVAAGVPALLLVLTACAWLWRSRRRSTASQLAPPAQARTHMAHIGRLAAMGEMSTTLAHELKQPLGAIVNYALGSIHRLEADRLGRDDLLKVLRQIADEGNRSADMIRRLRDFARDGETRHVPDDANRIVRDAVDLVRPAACARRVDIGLALDEALPSVVVDPVQIEQVVVNLVQNAIEAIDEAGSPRRQVVVTTQRNWRSGVDVTIRDTGPGVAADVGYRIFDSFVTTKREGTGLGLSISRAIVEAHGGRLVSFPNAGGGAAFRFTLPGLRP